MLRDNEVKRNDFIFLILWKKLSVIFKYFYWVIDLYVDSDSKLLFSFENKMIGPSIFIFNCSETISFALGHVD